MKHDTVAHETIHANQTALAEGYRQMASDQKRDMEAVEWTEALVGDLLKVTWEPAQQSGFE